MDLFSISQLAQFSGIKPHTIRMWEHRYNALKPGRSEGNTRNYNNAQLRRLLNIVSLTDGNHKVSEVCAMPDSKLFKLIEGSKNNFAPNDTNEYFISQLLAAGMSYNEWHFEKMFSNCLLQYGIKDTYIKVIYPMLARIGLLWSSDAIPPAHEHFISNIIKQKLYSAINSLPPPKPGSDSWLLFLPENEFHEIGLLFSHYLILLSGRKSIYLGSNVPLESLKVASKNIAPTNLLLFLVHHNLPEETQAYIEKLSTITKDKKIYLAGSSKLISQLKTGKKITWLKSVEDLEQQFLSFNV